MAVLELPSSIRVLLQVNNIVGVGFCRFGDEESSGGGGLGL